jgi:hypothetical protein
VDANQQVGFVQVTEDLLTHAVLWSGTAASWVDLNPAGSTNSQANGVYCGQQVGFAEGHAGLWTGSAASWVDLHPSLPSDFDVSFGQGIWSDGDFTYVVGYGHNATTDHLEALMWIGPPPTPVITEEPADTTLCVNSNVTFTVQASGPSPLNYRWRKNGQDLTCDARITGCTTTTLTINPVQPSDMGQYDVVVGSLCDSVTSNTAALVVVAGDFDCDGLVALSDYQYIRDGMGFCSPQSDYLSHQRADLDHDGCITLVDYQLWLHAYRQANGRDFIPPIERVPMPMLLLDTLGMVEDTVGCFNEP